MWPATAGCIGIVKPRFVLLENVPGIRSYLPVVVRDLRRLGYEVSRPLILGADDVGAPHRRKRVWIMAYSTGDGFHDPQSREGVTPRNDRGEKRAHKLCGPERASSLRETDVADANQEGFQDIQGSGEDEKCDGNGAIDGCGWWDAEPDVGRTFNGVASKLDLLKPY